MAFEDGTVSTTWVLGSPESLSRRTFLVVSFLMCQIGKDICGGDHEGSATSLPLSSTGRCAMAFSFVLKVVLPFDVLLYLAAKAPHRTACEASPLLLGTSILEEDVLSCFGIGHVLDAWFRDLFKSTVR